MILRDYQSDGVDRTLEALHRGKRVCLVSPTGSGKTPMSVSLIQRHGGRTIFLAHRRELITQAARHLCDAGINVGIIKAGYPRFLDRHVQVASVQTLIRRDKPPADLIILDEGHHGLASTNRQILEAYPHAHIVLATATPWHRGGIGLGDICDELIVAAYADDLVKRGYLVEPRVYAPPAEMLTHIKRRYGDYETKALARAVDKPKLIGNVVDTWIKYAEGRTTLAFGVNIEHSKHMADEFCKRGVRAKHVDGDTEDAERADAVSALADGSLDLISNVSLFGEGTDVPAIKCLIINCPTESHSRFLQMCGRAMRPTPDGQTAIVLDHVGATARFGRVTRRLEYSLAGMKPGTSESSGLKTCPVCYRMLLISRSVCAGCGYVFTGNERPLPQTIDGELQEWIEPDAQPTSADRIAYFDDLVKQSAEKWWKPGAVAKMYRERFGVYPEIIEVDGVRRLAVEGADYDVKLAMYIKLDRERDERKLAAGYPHARFRAIFGVFPDRHIRTAAGVSTYGDVGKVLG